jgi:hypothetical protein
LLTEADQIVEEHDQLFVGKDTSMDTGMMMFRYFQQQRAPDIDKGKHQSRKEKRGAPRTKFQAKKSPQDE